MSLRRSHCFLVFPVAAILSTFAFSQSDGQSLGDVARKLRKDVSDEVRMNDADTKRLFESVDKIIDFAAQDTDMPKRAEVKRRMVSKADVEKFARGRLAKEEFTQRFARGELSMKKLGFLPREFDLRGFLVKSTGQEVAGYYDEESKTISLLNWVPFDKQEPILAHELTHALQDQNYDLHKWMTAGDKATKKGSNDSDDDDGATARKAVVEGQAMVVYVDYLLKPVGRNLQNTPDLIYQMEEPAVKAVADSQLMHDAPMILREAGSFAYNEGLIFEGELLHKGGKEMAFAGVFARPPRNSHEVLAPEAYINSEKLPAVGIPDLKRLLGGEYEIYDSGGIGQLDVRAYLKQYGGTKAGDDISPAWQGGAYVTYKRKNDSAQDSMTTADLALVYVSRWKTPQAADRFARVYTKAVGQRYRSVEVQPPPTCQGTHCPISSGQIDTEEGPVIIELWSDNTVVVSESFDSTTGAKVQSLVHEATANSRASITPQGEIGLKLYNIPAFRCFAEQFGEQIARRVAATAGQP